MLGVVSSLNVLNIELGIPHLNIQYPISAHDAQSHIAMSEFQSNSPFPTSNSTRCLRLVRYGFSPALPTMSPQDSRSLWCFLESNSKTYNVFDIPIGANVFQLKALIQQTIKCVHNIDAYDLELLKVISLIPRACTF